MSVTKCYEVDGEQPLNLLEPDPATQPRGKGGRIRSEDMQPAFRYAMGLPGITTVVLSRYDLGELKQAIEWARSFEPLPEEELDQLLADGKQMADQWGEICGLIA